MNIRQDKNKPINYFERLSTVVARITECVILKNFRTFVVINSNYSFPSYLSMIFHNKLGKYTEKQKILNMIKKCFPGSFDNFKNSKFEIRKSRFTHF